MKRQALGKAILAIHCCVVCSSCGAEAKPSDETDRLAGRVEMQHFECRLSSYEEPEANFLYKVVYNKDTGFRETIKTRSGGEMVRHPIREAQIIRPDGSLLAENLYVLENDDRIVSFFNDRTRAYLDLKDSNLSVADPKGPLKGDGEGECTEVQPSDALKW